jgi:hypothetical protein
VLLMLTYVFGCLQHGLTDVSPFSSPANAVVASSVDTNDGHSDEGTAAGHHCHGCFPVSISAPPEMSATVEPRISSLAYPQVCRRDRVPELDTPPPKFLT